MILVFVCVPKKPDYPASLCVVSQLCGGGYYVSCVNGSLEIVEWTFLNILP